MTNLEILNAADLPPIQVGPDSVVIVDYAHVTTAVALADKVNASRDAGLQEAKDLADAVIALSGILTELVRGIHRGELAVHNYPVDGAHLE